MHRSPFVRSTRRSSPAPSTPLQQPGPVQSQTSPQTAEEDIAVFNERLDGLYAELKESVNAQLRKTQRHLLTLKDREVQSLTAEHRGRSHTLELQVEQLQEQLAAAQDQNAQLTRRNESLSAALVEQQQKHDRLLAQGAAFSNWRVSTAKRNTRNKLQQGVIGPLQRREFLRRFFSRWRVHARRIRKANLESMWREHLERTVRDIVDKYEGTLDDYRSRLQQAQDDVSTMQDRLTQVHENMKRAFMRGVSVLNMEALQVFEQGVAPYLPHGHQTGPPERTPPAGTSILPFNAQDDRMAPQRAHVSRSPQRRS